jgi:Pin2-interacting protein X1
MAAQGWQPGEYLGAKDANHAEHYTAANASHIRVMIKDDNLGLGAKIGSGVGHGECTGLDAFKDLLGRLNGKDEDEIEKEQKSREDLKRAIYTEKKWGSVRFVRGGFLIGDKIQDLIDGEAERLRKLANGENDLSESESSESEEEAPVEQPKKSKKRRLGEEEPVSEVVAVKVKKPKKKQKSEITPDNLEEVKAVLQDVKILKKLKKSRDVEQELEAGAAKLVKKRLKKEKKRRQVELGAEDDTSKLARQGRKKEVKENKARKEEGEAKSEQKETKDSKRKSKRKITGPAESSELSSKTTTEASTPLATPAPSSGYSTPMMQGRHAVRSRNIAQKRLASMDVASLNQVRPNPYVTSVCSFNICWPSNIPQIFMIRAPV